MFQARTARACFAACLGLVTSVADAGAIDLSGVWRPRQGERVLCRRLDAHSAFRASFVLELAQAAGALEAFTMIGTTREDPAQPTAEDFFFGCPAKGLFTPGRSSDGERAAALLTFDGISPTGRKGIYMGSLFVRHAETWPADARGRSGRIEGRYVAVAEVGIIECRLHLLRVSQDLAGRLPFDEGCIVP